MGALKTEFCTTHQKDCSSTHWYGKGENRRCQKAYKAELKTDFCTTHQKDCSSTRWYGEGENRRCQKAYDAELKTDFCTTHQKDCSSTRWYGEGENRRCHKAYRSEPDVQYRELVSSTKREVYITYEQFIHLRKQPCHYCSNPLPTTGYCLDRKDNLEDYTLENTVPCCWECNFIKGSNLSEYEMLAGAKALVAYRAYGVEPALQSGVSMSKKNCRAMKLSTRYKKLIRVAIKRGIEMLLSEEEYTNILRYPCTYCGGSIMDTKGYGLDRVDNDLREYSVSNCIPACGVCNMIRGSILTPEETMVVVRAVQKVRLDTILSGVLSKAAVSLKT